jgi:hypothetical protein
MPTRHRALCQRLLGDAPELPVPRTSERPVETGEIVKVNGSWDDRTAIRPGSVGCLDVQDVHASAGVADSARKVAPREFAQRSQGSAGAGRPTRPLLDGHDLDGQVCGHIAGGREEAAGRDRLNIDTVGSQAS